MSSHESLLLYRIISYSPCVCVRARACVCGWVGAYGHVLQTHFVRFFLIFRRIIITLGSRLIHETEVSETHVAARCPFPVVADN